MPGEWRAGAVVVWRTEGGQWVLALFPPSIKPNFYYPSTPFIFCWFLLTEHQPLGIKKKKQAYPVVKLFGDLQVKNLSMLLLLNQQVITENQTRLDQKLDFQIVLVLLLMEFILYSTSSLVVYSKSIFRHTFITLILYIDCMSLSHTEKHCGIQYISKGH